MRQWWEKFKWSLSRWMQGRYGQDSLSKALFVIALIVLIAASFTKAGWLSYLSTALLVWSMFRMLSKNIEKRRAEDEAWRKLTRPVRQWWQMTKRRYADRKTYRYFKCPKCGQTLRVPKGKGKIAITCRSCAERFERKT